MLLELSRLGSMRRVAERLGTTTSTVSQQLAALAREAGTPLTEPAGRRVRLTPAGRRLAAHAATILGAVEAARHDLDPVSEPAGTVHVSAFAPAIVKRLLPVVSELGQSHPNVHVIVHEHEPAEALAQIANDDVDLALTYDYNLAPVSFDTMLETVELWSSRWSLGVPTATALEVRGDAPAVFATFREDDWIGNSRNRADEDVVRIIASMAGFEPRLTHQSDSLEIVEELIINHMGVGLLPADRPTRTGITLIPLIRPELRLRAYAHTRRGRARWPALRVVLERLGVVGPHRGDGDRP